MSQITRRETSTNMVYGNPYLPSQLKGYKPRRKPKNDTIARFLFILALFGLLMGAWLLSHPEPARAQVIELKDCRTNLECCRLAIERNTGYVREESVEAKCKKLNHPSL